jgi:hypothetical protein
MGHVSKSSTASTATVRCREITPVKNKKYVGYANTLSKALGKSTSFIVTFKNEKNQKDKKCKNSSFLTLKVLLKTANTLQSWQ